MSRRMGRMLAATLTVSLALSAGTAVAASTARLKQFKVPTASSSPRDITNGADGNRWFIEGTEFTGAPAKIARVTPAGAVTEFSPTLADGCNFCILTDIQRGQGELLYTTSNDPELMCFNVQTQQFLAPVAMPNSGALAGQLAVAGDHVWITDFNNHVVWRYNSTTGVFDAFPANPSDITVDGAGTAWFTETQANLDGTSNIARICANASPSDINAVTRTVTTAAARSITVSPLDGKVWFAAQFAGQGVGFLDPANNNDVTFFPVANTGPGSIAASPDGTIWFTQELTGNVATITNTGAITEFKAVRGSTPQNITVGPNGDPWYTLLDANKIATLQLL